MVTSQTTKGATRTQQRLEKTQRLRARMGWQANLQKQGRWWTPELISGTKDSIQMWIAPHCWGRNRPNRALVEGQHNCCLVNTTALNTLYKLVVSPPLTIPTNLVERRNQILITSQSLCEITSELLLEHQYQDWTHMELLQNVYKILNFLLFLNLVFFIVFLLFSFLLNFHYYCIGNFTITILSSLLLPSSLSLFLLCYNLFFSLRTTLSAPSHQLFSPSSPPLHFLHQCIMTLALLPTHSPPAD
jgi:hypothetical protein